MRSLLIAILTILVLLAVVLGIGWSLPVQHQATCSTQVPMAPAELFARLTDVRGYPRWRTGVSSVEVVRGPDTATGLRFREHSSDGAILFEVIERQPPTRLVTRIADRSLPFGGSWTFQLSATTGGTDLSIIENGEIYNPVFRFAARFVLGHTATVEQFLRDVQRMSGDQAARVVCRTREADGRDR
jgi:uncharacterized protein YndB with AHSA1/START domain